jgi:hypothetical protein
MILWESQRRKVASRKSSTFQSPIKGIIIRQNSAKNRFSYLRVDLLNIVIVISNLQAIKNPSISKLKNFWQTNHLEMLEK